MVHSTMALTVHTKRILIALSEDDCEDDSLTLALTAESKTVDIASSSPIACCFSFSSLEHDK